jgi:putative endonuclease
VDCVFPAKRRICEPKIKAVPGFPARYDVDRLVWFETHRWPETAARREKQINGWRRDWKINLIERDNPHWTDHSPSLSP